MARKYEVIVKSDLAELAIDVNEALADGYIPCGGITVNNAMRYMQAVYLPPITITEEIEPAPIIAADYPEGVG